MADVWVCRGEDGKLRGWGAKGERAFAKFLRAVQQLGEGELMRFGFRLPRSGPYHRRFFAILGALHGAQEQFEDEDELRLWLQVGAGHCLFVPGPTGRMVAIPKSIDYVSLDQAEFEQVVDSVIRFVRSDHAQAFLWPHLGRDARSRMVDAVLAEFGE